MAESNSAALHFTTRAFGPGEKKAAWHEVYGRTIAKVDLEPRGDGDLMIEAALRTLPGLGLVSMTSTELRFHKTRRLIDNDDVILTIVDTGYWNGSQLGREIDLQAGDAVLSTTAEIAAGTSFGRRLMLRVPNKAIAPAVADLGARFLRRIPRETDGLRLLRRYMRALQDLDLATSDLQSLTVTHIYDLMALTLGATGDVASLAEDRGAGTARLRAVKEDIVRNLVDGDLSVATVAARHRISSRYLAKLFEREGVTFSEYVLDQRLALAHRLLSDPRRARDKIASLAFAAGFGDVSYFYRAFRRRYDLLPTDVRAQARGLH
ncbi:MAG: AraC family transcriptional regulator [Xanthobacteraceae bacterium]